MRRGDAADAPPRDSPARPPRWFWVGVVTVVTACSAALVPLRDSGPPTTLVTRDGGPADADEARPPAPAADALATAQGPESRLIAAYVAFAGGDGRGAFDLVHALVRDHPDFTLAQLFYSDLLATRAGLPSVFGVDRTGWDVEPADADPGRLALREEARRRLVALLERPPTDRLPAEFVALSRQIRHAVAVDASRSRLYLFANEPQGLRLVSDMYVSIGKQGVAKRVEGDQRTPLGVYWITAALEQQLLDERFGSAALRINYPNAWDRLNGRTGSGLFLHGVPRGTLARPPLETDGCVAMSNDDAARLLALLDVDTTPVVIADRLHWVEPVETAQAAAEFRPAYEAWDNARRHADPRDLRRWYADAPTVPASEAIDFRPALDASFVAWNGDGAPMMIVTTRRASHVDGAEPDTFRQYWIQRRGRWRILFDGPVPTSRPPGFTRADRASRADRAPARAMLTARRQ